MLRGTRSRRSSKPVALAAAGALAVLLAAAPTAGAHIERASYWPNPGFDTAGDVPTGGSIPRIRGLFSALKEKPPGDTRVVCQGKVAKRPELLGKKGAATPRTRAAARKWSKRLRSNKSYKRLNKAVKKAQKKGYEIQPSKKPLKLKKKKAKRLLKFNVKLLKRCKFRSIQDAVNASGNNDRVVVMPGVYTEPKSRAAPTNDPSCDGLEEENDKNQTAALSYRYQVACPNDQNLIAILGRAPNGAPPQPPNPNRHNIPDEGPCVRCNLQLEGSGVGPDDVIVDAGRVASGNKGPAEPAKDVVIRADRADGFVLRNLTTRHATEHGVYVLEVDGFVLDRFQAYYNEEYGLLTFTSDHGLIQTCDAAGSGDAGLYPGSAAETGEQTSEPGGPRYNQELRFCDMHHNAIGYSGTSANAVWVHHNDFYGNALGFSSDVFTAAGHPGFPQDSDLVENNRFYSNNFNPYVAGSDIDPTVPVPVGVGLWFAGGNNNVVRNNHFWDNWRRGTMLFAVPDTFVCNDPEVQIPGCSPGEISTSHRNRFHGNEMGVSPKGVRLRNGLDFWWDQFPSNANNCWFDNTGTDGTAGSVTSSPMAPLLPSECATSVGTGSSEGQQAELIACLAAIEGGPAPGCNWFETPPKP